MDATEYALRKEISELQEKLRNLEERLTHIEDFLESVRFEGRET